MSEAIPNAKPKSARTIESRAGETKDGRRRRKGMGMERNLKLHVPEELKDPNFVYRFVNDRPGRVRQLTQMDDYSVVSANELNGALEPEKSTAEGTVVTRTADSTVGERVVLLKKPREYYEADRKEHDHAIAAHEDTMRRGRPLTPDADNGDHAYTPGGKNIIAKG
jgi:hypothetical protein